MQDTDSSRNFKFKEGGGNDLELLGYFLLEQDVHS